MIIKIVVKEKVFEFATFTQWVNKAREGFLSQGLTAANSIVIDAKGRPITKDDGFDRARDEDAFPIAVYELS